MANPGNVIGGHKANLNNPRTILIQSYVLDMSPNSFPETSEESKKHSREVLENEFNGGDTGTTSDRTENKNPGNV
jgi:hypothetical protein